MNKALATRDRLLTEARRLLWSRGYSNVPLREIAQGAGVDVALIARYFGSKLGLFEATLENAFAVPDLPDEDTLIETVLRMFVEAPRDGNTPSVLQLIQTNANDPDVGDIVRRAQAEAMQDKLEALLGSPARAALFMSVLLGFGVGEKTLKLKGIASPGSPAFEAQLRHLMTSALSYKGP
ncbi:TetR/AcrR family transcriptional regulator [Marimonas sp. MJW-29]|uniref:TetR/AcrR family transcriptional regulator n=1 Tax=Sulfitobacter sediminis TaxID=3234186 RepID=A0ABV3RMN2_9RHOB